LGGSLTLAAVIEALIRAAISGADPELTLVLGLLALGTTLPLVVVGRLGAASICCATSVLSLAAFHTLTAAGFAVLLITLYRLSRGEQHHPLAQLTAVALGVPFVVLVFTGPPPTSSEAAVLTVLVAALAPVASLGGLAQRARREARDNRAARQVIADTLIEHTARGERARIARELHDVVAHHISMVAVQAEAARLAVPGMPPAGAQRLSARGDSARAALVEMRRFLGVLRHDTQPFRGGTERHPQPSLDQLTELIDEARSASGSAIRLILRGAPVALDPGVELVAYRIVQEALTNAMRHAPGAAIDVELTYIKDTLRLRVRDNGPGPDPRAATGGHGVAGMYERAAAVGGTLHTSLAPGGGYLIDATLPTEVEQPA
jgi:signal transduction histidine kinase